MKISRILHAGWQFENKGTCLLFDPIFENPFSGNCFAWPEVKFDTAGIRRLQVDAIFISHYHDDHCSFESLAMLNRETPIYMYCVYKEMFELIGQLGFKNVHPLKLDETVRVGEFEITTRLALDSDVDAVFQISADGLNVLNVVDSWLDPATVDVCKKVKWDLILWPFQTMREIEVLAPALAAPAEVGLPRELMQQLQMLNPKAIVPGSCQFIQESWSWYREAYFPVSYQRFAEEVKVILPQTKVVRMNPGVSFELAATGLAVATALPYVIPVGPQDVDYAYNPQVIVPGTAEIARHFPALDAQETAAVLQYCKSRIIEKFRSLEVENAPSIWELRLFDNQGITQSFFYQIEGNAVALLNDRAPSPDWRTEVSIFKLHSALYKGEALSSMYVRINDGLERALLSDVDIMSDPLVRCLFTGVFASYQKAQLKVVESLCSKA